MGPPPLVCLALSNSLNRRGGGLLVRLSGAGGVGGSWCEASRSTLGLGTSSSVPGPPLTFFSPSVISAILAQRWSDILGPAGRQREAILAMICCSFFSVPADREKPRGISHIGIRS